MRPEPILATNLLYAARPTVEVEGRVHPVVQELLVGMEVEEAEGGMAALELRFANTATVERRGVDYAFEFSDVDLLSLGRPIRVSAGDEADPQEIFRGVISGVEFVAERDRQPELAVLAEDALQRARLARRTALHEAGTLADLVEAVASRLGLRATVDGLRTSVGAQMQLNESDLAFLRRILDRYDADLQVVGEELRVAPRDQVRRSAVTLELGSQLRSVRALADLAQQTTRVTFSGWDPAQGRPIQVRSGSAGGLGPGTGRTGAQLLTEAFGERSEHLGNRAARDEAEAQALVDARFAQRARRFVRVEACAEGNPALRVGAHVTLAGLGPRFDNTYYLTRVRHRYGGADGYQTEFEGECAYFGG
ncbi:MAG: hypothetical protein Kow0092_31370 [Deferrisomatales bacterium]